MHGPFEPFQKVLVRDSRCGTWKCGLFSHIENNIRHKYVCVGSCYEQCIKFEGNEHLLGTTDIPTPKHEYKIGDYVDVYWAGIWNTGVYITKKKDEHVVYSMVDDTMYRAEDDEIRPLAEDSND